MIQPSDPAAQIAAAQFANTRNADEDKRESEQIRIAENLEINGEPRHPKEDRHKQGHDQSSQLLFDVLVRIGDCPIMIPTANAPSTVCTPMKLVTSARAIMITRMTLMTGYSMTK
jgi:hypothetical protein